MNIRKRIIFELERLRRKNLQQLHPLQQLFWESTLRCNVHCLHCGSDCSSSEVTPDMPAEDFLRVIDQSVTPHVDPHKVLIIISGGEPLMRTDLAEVGKALKQRGYPWGMVTNGLAMTEKRFKELMASGLRSMAISFDGMKDNHNWMRQHPLAFDGATRAIKLAAATPSLTWDVVTCVNQRTINQLDEMREYLWSIGVRNWRLITIDPMGRAAENPELLLSPEQHRYLLDYIRDRRKEGLHISYSCEGFMPDYEGEIRDYLFHCMAGISVASILIDGSISACTSIRGKYYQGNIYKDDFWDVWENRFESYRNREWMRKQEPCNNCKLFRYCEGGGMHLRREDGSLMLCHHNKLQEASAKVAQG
jgi:radical SAM enzyme (rSAM/lipoprotein system)